MTDARAPIVALFAKPHPDAAAVLKRAQACLQRHHAEILADEVVAESLGLVRSSTREEAAARAGLVVSVGGDGTLLAAARAVGGREIPILGINLGHLGFLTETRCEELDRVLELALAGRAPIEERRALAVIKEGAGASTPDLALNDVVISQAVMRLFSVSLHVDGEWVANYRADGLIISTPTGSTAYSLSAGGPVVSPAVDGLLITPICPHSLSQRPLLLPGSAYLSLALTERERSSGVQVTIDGQSFFTLPPDERLLVRRAEHAVRLVRPPGRTFFATLREKLGWGS